MFNKTIKNIMSNYIPHETIIYDDRDPPSINRYQTTNFGLKSCLQILHSQ